MAPIESRSRSRFLITVLAALLLAGLANAQTLFKADDGSGIHIFYRTEGTAPFIHYSTGSGWTNVPGYAMSKSNDSANFPYSSGWFYYNFASPTTSVEFLFNNGNGVWENNDENNYKINAAGAWQLTSTVSSSTLAPTPSENCYNYNGLDLCSSSTQTELPATDDQRKWQTPPRNASGWSSEYQDYRSLTGYAHVVYGSARTSATVTVRTYLRVASATCSYTFNGVKSTSATYQVTNSLMDDLIIVATCTDGSDTWKLELDPVNFVWQNNAVTQPSGMKGGQKGAIVDLFGWPYDDIAQECAAFLGKAGYMGVKINPPQESVLTDAWPQSGQRNPWYFVYQPVRYRIYFRLGSRKQLRAMIQTCRANGVRVYADAVVNHMTGKGNDALLHRSNTSGSCTTWGAKSSSKKSRILRLAKHAG